MGKDMKAIKVEVAEREWDKVIAFVADTDDDGIFLYQTGRRSFLVVSDGDHSMARAKAMIYAYFEEDTIMTPLKR